MIVEGSPRSSVAYWSKHLLRLDQNDRVEILETALWSENEQQSLRESLQHFQDMTKLTGKGEKGLYCAHIDPHGDYDMSEEQWERSIDILEQELGFVAQPRLVVRHTKNNREHIHVVWQRTKQNDDGRFVLISDSCNFKKHELASRAMETEFGHEHVRGVFTGRQYDEQGYCRDKRPVAKLNHKEWQRNLRTARDKKSARKELAKLWSENKTGKDFHSALERSGYILCQGDQKPIHMIVDRNNGELYDLRRTLKGEKSSEKRQIVERLSDYPARELETAARVRGRLREEQRRREGEARRQRLDDGQRDQSEAWDARAKRDVWFQAQFRRAANDTDVLIREIGSDHDLEESIRFEIAANKARASLQNEHHAQRHEYGNEAQSRRMDHGKMIRAEYSDDLRRKKEERAHLYVRQVEGGAAYKLTKGRADRRRIETLDQEIENTQQRMEEADGKFRREEGERRATFDQMQQTQSDELERRLARDRDNLPWYLDPERHGIDMSAEISRHLRPANENDSAHTPGRDMSRRRQRVPEPRPRPPNLRGRGGF